MPVWFGPNGSPRFSAARTVAYPCLLSCLSDQIRTSRERIKSGRAPARDHIAPVAQLLGLDMRFSDARRTRMLLDRDRSRDSASVGVSTSGRSRFARGNRRSGLTSGPALAIAPDRVSRTSER